MLVELDPRDYQIALDRARAELATAEAEATAATANVPITTTTSWSGLRSAQVGVEQSVAGSDEAQHNIDASEARLAAMRARLVGDEAEAVRDEKNSERLKGLLAKDEVSQQQYDAAVAQAASSQATVAEARAQVREAELAVQAARSRLAQARVGQQRADAELQSARTGPEQVAATRARALSAAARVKQAQVAVVRAELDFERTTVGRPRPASSAGRIAEPGQVVQPGQPLMALVPLDQIWVTANFKETQLEGMRVGTTGVGRRRCLRRPQLHRQGGEHRRRHGIAVQPAAARECQRQLRQGGPARAGEDRARRQPGSGAPAAAWHVRDADGVHPLTGAHTAVGRMSTPVNPWIVAIAVMFATFMEVLDTTVVNVSLPHIASSMSATTEEATWALTSYLVANAIILPMTGWLASRLGRKRLLMISTAGFTVASFLCGAAPNLASLVIFRIIQGATGGALQPLSQAVLLESFKPEERGRAMGFWGLGIVVAPILGPVVGGWLTENYSWRWVFYINLPFGVASLLMTRAYVHDPPYLKKATQGIDYWGMGMLVVGIGALQYVLDKGQQDDWFADPAILTLSILSAVTLTTLIVQQLRVEEPDRGSAALQGPDLRGRRVPDDGAGLRALRQPGAAAGDAADVVGLLLLPGGTGHGAARHRVDGDDAAGRGADRVRRSAPPADHRSRRSAAARWSGWDN